jgi:hypothetical protein
MRGDLKMRKSLLFFSGGMLVTAFLQFGLRQLNWVQNNVWLLIITGVAGTAVAVYGLFAKGRKGG